MNAMLLLACCLTASAAQTPVAAQQAPAPNARELYLKNCRQCHGTAGVPPRTMKAKFKRIPDLTDSTVMSGIPDDSVAIVIRNGVNNEQEMKGFADKLTADEIAAVVAYVRSLSAKPRQ